MKTVSHESAAAARRYYQSLAKLTGSPSAAVTKWKARQANKPLPPATAGRYLRIHRANLKRVAKVPLGDAGDGILRSIQAQDKRMNWCGGVSAAALLDQPRKAWEKGSNKNWSKRSTFRRGLAIQSYATCTWQVALLRFDGKIYDIPAPRGYRWKIDSNGLGLFGLRGSGDYHPTASELLAAKTDKCRGLVAKLKENAETRKFLAAKAKQQKSIVLRAEKEGAAVCVADSIRSGNCRGGSESWATRHGIDPRSHIAPTKLLAMANGDASRVAIVVASALRRHSREMDAGYCLLSEHKAK